MKLSIIVPVYNEKATVCEILDRIDTVVLDGVEKEVIIIDDGSTDGTADILKNLKRDNYKLVLLEKNSGKGCAIKAGISNVTGDIVIIQDADMEYDPGDYPVLIAPILKGRTKVVYGSRWLGTDHLKRMPWNVYKIARWGLTVLANLLYRARITDEPTCYKVFDAQLLKSIKLECTGFEFCPEITAKIKKRGYDIAEVPISYNPRSVNAGKKIKFKDGIIAIYTLIKYRFYDS